MVRLAIADPPYFGRGERWYGSGRGSHGGQHVADRHPDAGIWDRHEVHEQLVEQLVEQYDGWAIALSSDTLGLYLSAPAMPRRVEILAWCRPNSVPSASRIIHAWEPIIACIPPGRSPWRAGQNHVRDYVVATAPRRGFAGAKPAEWTRFILEVLGYDPSEDVVDTCSPAPAPSSPPSTGCCCERPSF